MVYTYREGVIVPFARKHIKELMVAIAALFIATIAATGLRADALTVAGCSFDDSVAGVWSLESDCTSSAQINVPAGTTVEGNGYTISPSFTKTSNSNNSAIGIINADGVTINDLTIDGSGGTALHGVHAYVSDNINLNDVTLLDNDRSGLVVNGSIVTVENITTGGNGWHGINVDLGGGVTGPAVLTVNGTSAQTDALHIYLDDSTKDVSVVDTESQYVASHPGAQPNDLLYTLKSTLGSDSCKKGGWATFTSPAFKNQGQCVANFNHHDGVGQDDKHAKNR